MQNFFATFMQRQAFRSHYVQIQAPNYGLARQFMQDQFGGQFMTVYTEQDFEGQVEDWNLERLAKVEVIDHSGGREHSIEYKVIS